MKLSQAKEYLPLVQAAAEGKTIQVKSKTLPDWRDIKASWLDYGDWFNRDDIAYGYKYRIKPEPKLRPWKPEEVPVGAVFRYFGESHTYLIGSQNGHSVSLCGRGGQAISEMPTKGEHSTDNGKTWKPCGVEE